ncbi:MAG: LamG-like jellyroll fold domain-containing protein [Caldilineaceae bacterium]
MFSAKKLSTSVCIWIVAVGLLALATALMWQPARAYVLPQSAYQRLQAAWQRAGDVDAYHYHNTIFQTVYPAATLNNVGRSPQTQRVQIEGTLDKAAAAMQMRLQVGQQPAIAVKIEDGQAYGRAGDNEDWIELEEMPELFAPGRDPLGFLAAVENVHEVSADEEDMTDLSVPAELLNATQNGEGIVRYAFDVSGPKYARFLRAQMEAELRRKGELPPSLSLSTSSEYETMTGFGEMWLDADGLPVRQLIHIEFAAQVNGRGPVSADISTLFSGWSQTHETVWSQLRREPTSLVIRPFAVIGVSPRAAQQGALNLGIVLFLLGLVALGVTHRRLLAVRIVLYSVIILSLVATPLLRAGEVNAFYDRQEERAPAAVPSIPETVQSNTFNPHENPVQLVVQESGLAVSAATTNRTLVAQTTTDCTVTESSDCDGDGLIDQVEIHQLGTFVDDADTDGDYISDYAEIQPFTVDGQVWYLDPRSADSNGDGLSDSAECMTRTTLSLDGAIDTTIDVSGIVCADTDGDGIPDVYDFDNDGDGVPDNVDASPFATQTVTDGVFGLNIANYAEDKHIAVDFQIRPIDDRHLWWADSYLDWPDNDVEGQVQRVTDETISDLGDMQLNPVLEITIPYDAANPTRGLPVKDGVDIAAIGQHSALADWLDTEAVEDMGLSVTEPALEDGVIYAYVMLTAVEDSVGDTPVALAGRMLYEMPTGASGWGGEQQVRLLWLVNGLADSCTVPDGLSDAEADSYCDDYANWTSEQTVLQSYYDDFSIASLTAKEDHGASAAIFAQPSAGEYYDTDLWHLADVLQQTYLTRGVDADTGQRLRADDIDTHLSAWGVGGLYVKELPTLADELTLVNELTGDNMQSILAQVRSAPADGDTANLLFALEQSSRAVSLGEESVSFTNGSATLNFVDAQVKTIGSLRWSPYTYTSGNWDNTTVTSDDGAMSGLQSAIQNVFTDDVLDGMASGSDPVADYDQARQGAAILATNYYLSLFLGASVVLESDATQNGETLIDSNYTKPSEPAVTIVSRLVGLVQDYYNRVSLNNLAIATTDAELQLVADSTWANLGESPGAVLEDIGAILTNDSAEVVFQSFDSTAEPQQTQFALDQGALVAMQAAAHYAKWGITGAEFLHSIRHLYEVARRVQSLRALQSQKEQFSFVAEFKEYDFQLGLKGQQFLNGVSQEQTQIIEAGRKAVKIGLVIELALIGIEFAWTLATLDIPTDSVDFNHLIANTVAKVLWAGIQFALSFNPYTALFFAVIHTIDAILSIACSIYEETQNSPNQGQENTAEKIICPGISGYIVEGITLAINDTTLLMDLEKEDQLEMVFDMPVVTGVDQAGGIAVGNTLALSATITANAYTGHPNWMGYIYNWQLRDENVKETAVDFRLQTSKTDFDNSLDFGDTAWARPANYRIVTDSLGTPTNPQPGKRFQATFQRSVEYTLQEPGVNVGLSGIYFSQAVRVKKQDCWLAPVTLPPFFLPFCGTDEIFDDTFHQSLEDAFVYDIFPATLDDFHALTQNVAGEPGYRLAWDDAFPVLRDGDGDGLVSKTFNGPDPDDNNPDTDGDGLSDFYEYQNGFNPSAADGDCDGLTDYWEAFYNTDPNHGDSDYDGLLDGREVLHPNIRYPYENSVFSNTTVPTCATENGLTGNYAGGWGMVYAFNGNTPLHFWVSADPNDPDSDDDGLTDRAEAVYGYNPHAPSELDVLALETSVRTSSGLDSYVGLDGSIDYVATVTNDLSDRYLRGLLESELPTDTAIKTQEIDLLSPLAASTLTGTIAIADAGITASSATSMTLRAGVIVDEATEQVLWLRMNESAGATFFNDASVYGNDATCTACPTSTGDYLRFSAKGQTLSLPQSSDLDAPSFSVGAWIRTDGNWGDFNIYNDNGDFHFWIEGDGFGGGSLWANVQGWKQFVDYTPYGDGNWHHFMATYDGESTLVSLYVNGELIHSFTTKKMSRQNSSIQVGQSGQFATTFAVDMDDLEFFPSALDADTIRNRYGNASVRFDLTSTGNGVTCSGDRCPSLSRDGASFDQTKDMTLDTSSLSFSNNQFSIAVDVKPVARAHPFDTTAGAYFGIDTSQDWQGVYGYQDPGNDKLIFPSLFIGSAGALRVDMGDGVDSCSYQTSNGVIDFDAEQQVTISFDGSAFTVYINGEQAAGGASSACGNVEIPTVSQLYAGRPNSAGYFFWEKVNYTYLDDPGDGAELCLNFDDNSTDGALWHDFNVTEVDTSHPRTDVLNIAKRIVDDSDHWFRFQEDDSSTSNCNYSTAADDDELVYRSGLSNVSVLGSTESPFSECFNCDEGTLDWSLSNQFFAGTLRSLSLFDYALSPQGAARLYNTETFALQMDFDEAPGETLFVDSSGNYFEAGCGGAACPDSGIPGRWNQALRFDGGLGPVADGDNNDGVVDYLTLAATDTALGFDGSFTLMAWVKPDTVSTHWQRIIGAGKANSANGVGFGLRAGELAFTTFGIKDYISAAAVPAGEWTHVAVSFDSNHDATFYVNGELVGKVTGSAAPTANTDDAYTIGALIAQDGSVGEAFDGLIDDLRILRFAAGAGNIQAFMNEAPLLNLHLDEDLETTRFVNDAPATADATCDLAAETCPGAGDKGALRESASFDGVDDRMEVADNDLLDLDTFTIALWAKPTQTRSDYQAILTKESSKDDRNYGLFLHPDNLRLTYGMASNCANGGGQNSVGALLQNQWNHVVMTYDGAQARVYINGSLDSSVLNVTSPCHNDQPVQIGDAIQRYAGFAGNLDEITIEEGARSAEQVAALYNYQSAWYDDKEQHTILVDADAPAVAVALNAAFIEPGQVLFIDTTDPVVNGVASGIASVQYSIDGGPFVNAAVDTNAYLIPASATQNLSEGSHTVQVRATDAVGLSTTSGQVRAAQTVQVDATAPQPGPGVNMADDVITVVRGSISLFGVATDNQGAVQSGVATDSVRASLRDHKGAIVSGPQVVDFLDTSQWATSRQMDVAPYGLYTFEATAKDVAGNEGYGSDTVWLDGLPGYGDMLINANVITGTEAVIGGLASDIPYPQTGRKLHFHFEEAAGSTLFYDGSTNHLNATCDGATCPTAGAAGQNDSALSFDGGDFLTIGDQAGISAAEVAGLNGSFTLMAWINPRAIGGKQHILASERTLSNGGIGFGIDGDRLMLTTYGVKDYISTQPTGLTAGVWHHVAANFDASTNDVTFYVDGNLLETVSGDADPILNFDDAIRLGSATAVGGATEEAFAGVIDELALYSTNLSQEAIYDVANPVPNNTSQVKVRYRHASGVVWPYLDPDGLALYLPLDDSFGSDSFEDLSVYGRNATCSEEQCPIAEQNDGLQAIETGSHLEFDGVDDYLSTPPVLDPASSDFSASVWFKVFSQEGGYILQQADGSGVGRSWLLLTSSGMLHSFLGNTTLEHPTKVADTQWHHAALTYAHAMQTLTLYLDGVPVSATRALEAADGAMLVGANKNFTSFFYGLIDEVAVFDRALSATEIGYLSQSPWYSASPIYNGDGGDVLGNDDVLRPWSHTVPEGLEGPYKIDLLVSDGPVPFQREGVSHAVWTGEIDTLAPRVALSYTLSTDRHSVAIACAAADLNLSEDGWACPVDATNRSSHYKDAEWYRAIFSDTEKLVGFTTAEELFTPGPGLYVAACDIWGQCITLAPEDTDGDGIPDTVEGEGDRDNDGILDAHDYDPDGHLYELGTGRILAGGSITVAGPGEVSIDPNGDTGYYDWTTDGTPGLYAMTVTPPAGYVVSPDCPAQAGAVTPTGTTADILGSSEVSSTRALADGSCTGNPYYLQFNVAQGEPFIFNNNIPLTRIAPSGPTTLFLPRLQRQVTTAAATPAVDLVASIQTEGGVVVTVRNVGEQPIVDGFWVDLYINPHTQPTGVNQVWPLMANQGAVWGVDGNVLPLAPGGELVLTPGDALFWPRFSQIAETLPAGTSFLVQVDSANIETTYGNVREDHERDGGTYNNIAGPVVSTAALDMSAVQAMAVQTQVATSALPARSTPTPHSQPDHTFWIPLVSR